MSIVLIKRTRSLNTLKQVEAHCKYVGFRSKELNEKGFFGRNSDKVNFEGFLKRIEDNPALKHSSTNKVHKLLFSLREKDYEAYKRSGMDYKDLIRKTLANYEQKNGVKLDWIANVHEKEGHPHCHVIIKGVSDEKDADGRYKRIKFLKEDYPGMKKDFDREFEKDVQYEWHENTDITKTLVDVTKGFEQVAKAVAKDAEKEQLKAEMSRAKDSTLHKEGKDLNKRTEKGKDKDR